MKMNRMIVIGGGAGGALAAVQLLLRGADVTLLEPTAALGRGMAYSTTCDLHLLNVPAANMSAFPDDPPHFSRWLERTAPGQYDACSFVPRRTFGAYVGSVLDEALRAANGRFRHVQSPAVAARIADRNIVVTTESAQTIHGDAAVLATGNAAPAPWPGLPAEASAGGRFFNVAWSEGAFEPSDPQESVLLLGSGLTAVDALLALRYNGHNGKVYMLSRRGLLPQVHLPPVSGRLCPPPSAGLRDLLRDMRMAAAGACELPAGWREAVDAIDLEADIVDHGVCAEPFDDVVQVKFHT